MTSAMDRLFSLLKLIELQVEKDLTRQYSIKFELSIQFVCSSIQGLEGRLVSCKPTNLSINLVQGAVISRYQTQNYA